MTARLAQAVMTRWWIRSQVALMLGNRDEWKRTRQHYHRAVLRMSIRSISELQHRLRKTA